MNIDKLAFFSSLSNTITCGDKLRLAGAVFSSAEAYEKLSKDMLPSRCSIEHPLLRLNI